MATLWTKNSSLYAVLLVTVCCMYWLPQHLLSFRRSPASPQNSAFKPVVKDWMKRLVAVNRLLKKDATPGKRANIASLPPTEGSRTFSISESVSTSPFVVKGQRRGQNTQQVKAKVKKLVLFYNMPVWFLPKNAQPFQDCPVDACLLTTNRSLLSQADAVIFHTFFFSDRAPPQSRPSGQIWVAFGLEPPYRLTPNMVSPQWTRAFNWTMTYRTDSDFFAPYGKLIYRGDRGNKNYLHLAKNKTKSAAWFVSHCSTHSRREEYVHQLQKHYPVDVYGSCGPYRCPKQNESSCSALLNSTYRFYLAFESYLCKDYVTEKFFKLFKQDIDIIPVVRGGLQYRKAFPAGTFIDTAEFSSPRHLARHLKDLEGQPEVYARMLREKDQYVAVDVREEVLCELCDKLHHDKNVSRYSSLVGWLTEGSCKSPTDLRF